MQLSESKTLENLKTAFANESAAMVRYEIFAEKAKQSFFFQNCFGFHLPDICKKAA